MVISQGDIHWIDFGAPKGSAPAKRRPCVIVQNDAFNASRISTVVVAAVTSNLTLGQAFGNVSLRKGEAGLKRKSVVNISQLITVDRTMLRGRIGKMSRRRLGEVLQGIYGLLRPIEPDA
jgi:mRNA interferase MazF